ncbi:MAG TPA: glycoside hydrolase family 2 TIM barrel-domain containing protein, partial [Prolixibacteraceae bacterium]|nr:glycoside hydrolase family 2 TIM barrel-domain containing protein [Prolixibacteraceae bacterium]
ESTIWYRKQFDLTKEPDKRYFLHFGAVNYKAKVFLNEEEIGVHEGGFTPFQFEVSNKVKDGTNTVVVWVNNRRSADGVPAEGYDWLNYGGITRDVHIIKTNNTFIDDYFIQLKKGSMSEIDGWVKLNGQQKNQIIKIRLPEIKKEFKFRTDSNGIAKVNFSADFELWTPEKPKLYQVIIDAESDNISDWIGFRTIETKGTKVLLNGNEIFLKGVNIHEENPFTKTRAATINDNSILLGWAKELGCNMVRLSHYPHNEKMVQMAEELGLMVWSEIPVYQHINFENYKTIELMNNMLNEMINRDKNRCSVIIWSVSNETYSSEARDKANIEMAAICRNLDPTRLVSAAFSNQTYNNNCFDIWDTLVCNFDIISINEYIGWYVPWQGEPNKVKWNLPCNKPLFISEFGGESHYGSNHGPKHMAAYWSDEYLENIYNNQVDMFRHMSNLAGVCPWILVDYRSTSRLHPVYQSGWNRKGLISEKGEKKRAWYIMNEYYKSIPD